MQLQRDSPKNTGNASITAENGSRGQLAFLIACFLISYLAGQVGHAQTAALADAASDQVRNRRQIAPDGTNRAPLVNDSRSDVERLAAGDLITVNPAVTHQTMRGWEVVAQADQFRPDYAAFQNAALDKVVEAGINRVRLEVRSGSENPVDSFAAWKAAGYPAAPDPAYVIWRARRYETINDNADPTTPAAGRFHWSELDSTVDLIVNPLRARMAAKGESLYVNLTYVAFYGQVTSGAPNLHQTPAEYAEFVLEAFKHLQAKYGWTPNAVNLVLEPDNTVGWSGTLMGQTVAAIGTRLGAAGFTPALIAPSTTNMSTAPIWFDQMMAVPNASTYVKELAYHRYSGVSTASLQSIATKSQAAGIASSMLEWWDSGNTFNVLHEDLTTGRNSAWQQATIVDLSGPSGLAISHINPATPTVATLTNPTKFTQQYFKYVRNGAVRLGATSNTGWLAPLAFRNSSGTHTVVVKAATGGTFSVSGLPAGTYGIYYTASTTGSSSNPDLYAVGKPDQTIASGQDINTDIPAYGVITIYGKTGGGPLPIAANDVYATGFNTPLTVAAPGVLGNDNANGGGSMTAVVQSAASSGTVVLNANGGFTYTPASGFTGAASFTYRASNASGQSNTATVTIAVGAPGLPTATNDSYATAFNTALTIATPGVLGNDSANGGGTITALLQSAASSGSVSLNSSGGFVYTPATGFSGSATFSYRASTAGGQSNVATVTVNVTAPSLPTATNDSYATAFNTVLTIATPGVLGNDNANGGGAMTAALQSGASSGTVSLNANGGFTYTPASGFSGAATFTYRASTAGGQSNVATVSINVTAAGLPTATNDSYATGFNTPLTISAPGVLGNDNANGGGSMTAVLQTGASSGTVAFNANGGFVYTPATGFSGSATFTYRASNAGGQSNVATVAVTVAGSSLPTATSDTYASGFDTPLTVATPGVLGNDNANGSGAMTAVLQTGASSGTVAFNANGSFVYTPAWGFSGAATFTYRVSTTSGLSNVATVTINVAAASSRPTAVDDTYSTGHNSVLNVPASGLLANDGANGGGTMTAVQFTAVTSGSVNVKANGGFTYTPLTGFSGAATFIYLVTNANGYSNRATVTVSVSAPNLPTATDDAYATAFNTPLTVAAPGVLGNDNANGGGTMTAGPQWGTSSGSVTLNANGSFTYTPAAGFHGAATFWYRVSNTGGVSDGAIVTVNVSAPNAPVASNDSYITAFGTTLTWAAPGVLGNDNGNGGGAMTAAIVSTTSNGILSLSASGGFTYAPNATFFGVDRFTYRASNTAGAGTTATVAITVTRQGEPLPPRNLRITSVSGNTVTFGWVPIRSGPAPTGFQIEGGLSPGEVLGVLPVGPVSSVTVDWPSDGSFYVRVRAVAGDVTSMTSNEIPVHVNVPMPPSSPANLIGLASGDALNLVWTNTYFGGAPTNVVLTVSGALNGSLKLGVTDTFSVAGVPPGTYTFSLMATNAGGSSVSSNPVTLTFPTGCSQAPQTVTNLVAYRVDRTLFLSWDPPGSGTAPTTYVVNVTGSYQGSLPTPLKAISGPVPPGTYIITVVATNPCGASAASASRTVVIP